MPQLVYTANSFPQDSPPGLSGNNTLSFSWPEIVWAAITVGRAGLREVLQFGKYSEFEIVYRTAILYANLCETQPGYLTRSDAYKRLDPSEKSAISYFLGLTLSKLFADRCLRVPWLMHLDVYGKQLNTVLKQGREKPDLVGLDAKGRWYVIESKGRTNNLDKQALRKAKDQASRVQTINGVVPLFQMGAQAYFESDCLRLIFEDPPLNPKLDPLPDLPITAEMVHTEYYRPFEALTKLDRKLRTITINDRQFLTRSVPAMDLTIGLDKQHHLRPSEDGVHSVFQKTKNKKESYIGSDGVLVQLGPRWGEEQMILQPEARD